MLLLLVVASVAVTVEGDTTCPSPARVSEALAPLLAEQDSRGEHRESHRALLVEHRDGIDVELRSGVGRVLGKKILPRSNEGSTSEARASCDELAFSIAVTLATWEAGLAGRPPAIDLAAPAPVSPTPLSAVAPTTLTLAAAMLGTLDRSGAAAGVLGELAIVWPARWSLRIAALATTRKHDDLAPGRVAWARDAFVIGARYRLAGRAISLAATGDAVLGVLIARGEDFTSNRTSYSFEPGVAAGLRVTLARGALGLFVEASDTVWLRAGQLQVTGLTPMPDLPRHELRVGLGLAIRIAER